MAKAKMTANEGEKELTAARLHKYTGTLQMMNYSARDNIGARGF